MDVLRIIFEVVAKGVGGELFINGATFISSSSTFAMGAECFGGVVTCAGTETFCVEVVEVAGTFLV